MCYVLIKPVCCVTVQCDYHTPTRSLLSANTNLLSAPCVRTTFASSDFSIAAPQSGTHSHLAFVTLPLPIPFVTLKLTASSRPSALPSDSPKCFRFGHWLTLCTLNKYSFTYLLTYLLTYLTTGSNVVCLGIVVLHHVRLMQRQMTVHSV